MEATTLVDPLGSGARSCVPTDEPATAKPYEKKKKKDDEIVAEEEAQARQEAGDKGKMTFGRVAAAVQQFEEMAMANQESEKKTRDEQILKILEKQGMVWTGDESKDLETFKRIRREQARKASEVKKDGEVAKTTKEQLNPLVTIEPENLNRVDNKDGWEEVKLYVDSGATETVITENMLGSIILREGLQALRGVEYEVANGITIPNLGERKFTGETEAGVRRSITAQVCEVNKALLSVSKAVAAGNEVVLGDHDGPSYIEDKVTGETMWLV